MQKRKKAKNYSSAALSEVVMKLPQSLPPPRSAYYNPFKHIIDGLKLHAIRGFLDEYRKELSISDWSPECLDRFAQAHKLSDCVDDVISCCLPLGSLHDITRFLFSKYSCQKARFASKDVHKVRVPLSRFIEQADDNVLMMSLVVKLNSALDKTSGSGSAIYKSNVYYVRKDGLSVFSIDRYDLLQPNAEAQFSIVYLVDAVASFFVLPFTIPIDVTVGALQAALGLRLQVTSADPRLPLHSVVKQEAKTAGLRRDVFSDHLKNLLHFQANTLRQMIREPHLSKYPTQHECAFSEASFAFADGFEVTLKRRQHENLLESLYRLETKGELRIPEQFVAQLATNSKNSFSAFELSRVSKRAENVVL